MVSLGGHFAQQFIAYGVPIRSKICTRVLYHIEWSHHLKAQVVISNVYHLIFIYTTFIHTTSNNNNVMQACA